MSGIDYTVLGIITISILIGIWRGFLREALSVAVWISAFWLAYVWAETVEAFFIELIDNEPLRLVVAFVLLFLAVHIVGFVISRLLAKLINSSGLKGVDRVAGGGFGFVRGILVVSVVTLVVGMTPIAEKSAWQQSYMVGVFNEALSWVQFYYPSSITESYAQATE